MNTHTFFETNAFLTFRTAKIREIMEVKKIKDTNAIFKNMLGYSTEGGESAFKLIKVLERMNQQ